jgi:hypothetical protein
MARKLECARVQPREVTTIESSCLTKSAPRAMVSSFDGLIHRFAPGRLARSNLYCIGEGWVRWSLPVSALLQHYL